MPILPKDLIADLESGDRSELMIKLSATDRAVNSFGMGASFREASNVTQIMNSPAWAFSSVASFGRITW